jgi:hypothetical protein
MENRILILALPSMAAMFSRAPGAGSAPARLFVERKTMKTGMFSASSQVQQQKPFMSMRAKIAVVIVVLSICSLGAWALIQNALRATAGHS